jgi:hypothetical protein
MIEANIIRSITFNKSILFFCDFPQIVEPAWPHLSLVYQILTKLAQTIPSHDYFSPALFRKLLIPSASPDSNERKAICDFFAALFRTSKHLRQPLITLYESVLIDYCQAHEHSPFLICTILSVLFYVIEQTVPLLVCADRAFVRGVLPLLRDRDLTVFGPAVERLVTFFVEDRPSHAAAALAAVVEVFPTGNTQKQLQMLDLIGATLDSPSKAAQELAIPVARTIARAGESQNESVAETALRMWGKAGVDRLIGEQRRLVLPFVVPSIARVVGEHWSFRVRQAAKAAFAMFQKRDAKLVRQISLESGSRSDAAQPLVMKQWVAVAKSAYGNDARINLGGAVREIAEKFRDVDNWELHKATILGMAHADSERSRMIAVPRVANQAFRL